MSRNLCTIGKDDGKKVYLCNCGGVSQTECSFYKQRRRENLITWCWWGADTKSKRSRDVLNILCRCVRARAAALERLEVKK